MRRIISKEEEAKKRKRNRFLVGGVLIFVMLFSVLGFAFQGGSGGGSTGNSNEIIYNNFKFINQNNLWFTGNGNLNFVFAYNPNEVDEPNYNVNTLTNYYGKPLYIYSEDKDAETEIYRNFDPRSNPIVQRIQPACFSEEKCEGDLPIKTCEDNFIIIRESNVSKVTQDQNCVYIEGPKEDLTRITDGFLFKLFEIAQ